VNVIASLKSRLFLRPRAALPHTGVALAGVAVAALLAGCSYRVDDVETPVQMPPAWDATASPTASAEIAPEWWKGFSSPVLEDLINQALAGSPTIVVAEERLKQAERALSGARDDLFPDLSVNASTGRSRNGGKDIPTTINSSTTASAQLRYDVDIWGGTAARYRAQKATLLGTRYDLDATRLTLSANVAAQYFQLLSTRARVDISRENLAIAERLLAITDSRFRNGVTRALDLSQQTTQVLQQRTALIQQEAQLRQLETALGLLLGQTPQEFHVAGEPFEQLTVPEVAPWAPGELLLRRPDLAAAETDLSLAHANVAIARSSLLPGTLSFSASGTAASAELLSFADAAKTFSLSGVLGVAESIFNFRAKRTTLLNAKSNEFITLTNYAQTIRTALKDVDDSLANVQTDQRREESQRATLEQAQRALRLAELEYREGTGSQQDLLDAQRSQFTAQDSLSQIRLARLTSALDLYVALGGGWNAPAN
jgi:NodT family efflux transporter outer membrane factor (OMF) lipoprotein